MRAHIPEEQISAWVDRQLDPREAESVDRHLRTCDECRASAREMLLVTEVFRTQASVELPGHLWSEIMSRLEEAPRQGRQRLWGWLWPSPERPIWLRPLAWGLTAFLLLACGSTIWLGLRPTGLEQLASAEIARIQSALVVMEQESSNPFRSSPSGTPRANPFAQGGLDPNRNPFHSMHYNR